MLVFNASCADTKIRLFSELQKLFYICIEKNDIVIA